MEKRGTCGAVGARGNTEAERMTELPGEEGEERKKERITGAEQLPSVLLFGCPYIFPRVSNDTLLHSNDCVDTKEFDL